MGELGMKTIVLFSGGLDSTVLLYQLMREGGVVIPLSVDYSQRHGAELDRAVAIAKLNGLSHTIAYLGEALEPVFRGSKSSQVGSSTPVPHGHYADDNMRVTIVPNRNMLLISVAGALADSIGAEGIAYAAHAGDHAIYPDCRPEFVSAMTHALAVGTTQRVVLDAPFQNMSKADIVRRGHRLGVPFGMTYSCYEGEEDHCGKCGTCVERKEAFQVAGVEDPTVYKA